MAGVGKSEAAKQFYSTYRPKYHSTFWLSCESRPALHESVRKIATQVKALKDLAASTDMDSAKFCFQRWFSSSSATAPSRCLIVVDAADTIPMLDHVVRDWLPGDEWYGDIVFTTRLDPEELRVQFPDAYSVEIKCLKPGAAEQLLRRRAWGVSSVQEARNRLHAAGVSDAVIKEELAAVKWLAQKEGLGGLPLALLQAGTWVEKQSRSAFLGFHEYKRQLLELPRGPWGSSTHDDQTPLSEWLPIAMDGASRELVEALERKGFATVGSLRNETLESLKELGVGTAAVCRQLVDCTAASLARSRRSVLATFELHRTLLKGAAKQMLSLVACFGVTDVPLKLVREATLHLPAKAPLRAMLRRLTPPSPIPNNSHEAGAGAGAGAAAGAGAGAGVERPTSLQETADMAKLADVAKELQSLSLVSLTDGNTVSTHKLVRLAARSSLWSEDGVAEIDAAVRGLKALLPPRDIRIHESWREASSRDWGPLLPHVLELGIVVVVQGWSPATPAGRRELAVALQACGSFRVVMQDQELAEKLLNWALGIRQELGDVDAEMKTRLALGRVHLLNLQVQKAKAAFKEVRKYCAEISPADPDLHGEAFLRSGAAYHGERSFHKAERMFKRAQEVFDRCCPSCVAAVHERLAQLYRDQHRLTSARQLYEQVLVTVRRLRQRTREALILGYLGNTLKDLRVLGDAEAHLLEAVKLCRELLPDQHPKLAYCLHALGDTYRLQGRKEAARECFQESLDIRLQVLSFNHPSTIATLNKLALTHLLELAVGMDGAESRRKENLAKAEKLLLSARKRHPCNPSARETGETALPQNPVVATTHFGLGVLYAEQGKYPEAMEQMTQALELRKHHLFPGDPRLGEVMVAHSLLSKRMEEVEAEEEESSAVRPFLPLLHAGAPVDEVYGSIIGTAEGTAVGPQLRRFMKTPLCCMPVEMLHTALSRLCESAGIAHEGLTVSGPSAYCRSIKVHALRVDGGRYELREHVKLWYVDSAAPYSPTSNPRVVNGTGSCRISSLVGGGLTPRSCGVSFAAWHTLRRVSGAGTAGCDESDVLEVADIPEDIKSWLCRGGGGQLPPHAGLWGLFENVVGVLRSLAYRQHPCNLGSEWSVFHISEGLTPTFCFLQDVAEFVSAHNEEKRRHLKQSEEPKDPHAAGVWSKQFPCTLAETGIRMTKSIAHLFSAAGISSRFLPAGGLKWTCSCGVNVRPLSGGGISLPALTPPPTIAAASESELAWRYVPLPAFAEVEKLPWWEDSLAAAAAAAAAAGPESSRQPSLEAPEAVGAGIGAGAGAGAGARPATPLPPCGDGAPEPASPAPPSPSLHTLDPSSEQEGPVLAHVRELLTTSLPESAAPGDIRRVVNRGMQRDFLHMKHRLMRTMGSCMEALLWLRVPEGTTAEALLHLKYVGHRFQLFGEQDKWCHPVVDWVSVTGEETVGEYRVMPRYHERLTRRMPSHSHALYLSDSAGFMAFAGRRGAAAGGSPGSADEPPLLCELLCVRVLLGRTVDRLTMEPLPSGAESGQLPSRHFNSVRQGPFDRDGTTGSVFTVYHGAQLCPEFVVKVFPSPQSQAPSPASATLNSERDPASTAVEDRLPFAEDGKCHMCSVNFGLFTRRHHCRRCGHSVCDTHSKGRRSAPGYTSLQRVCDECVML